MDKNNVEAFFERLIIVPFLYAKPADERDPDLSSKLLEEKDYIFTWAMKGLKRLMDNNFQFSISESSKKELERYKTESCPEQAFIDQYLTFAKDSTISREEVKEKYKEFAKTHGMKVREYDIKQYIQKNLQNEVVLDRKRINGSKNARAVYIGLAWR